MSVDDAVRRSMFRTGECKLCYSRYYVSDVLPEQHLCESILRVSIDAAHEGFAVESRFKCMPGLQLKVLQSCLSYMDRLASECRGERPMSQAAEFICLFAMSGHESARDARIREGQRKNGIVEIPCTTGPSPDGLLATVHVKAGRDYHAHCWVGAWEPPVDAWERVDWRRRREASSMSLPEYIARRAIIMGLDVLHSWRNRDGDR